MALRYNLIGDKQLNDHEISQTLNIAHHGAQSLTQEGKVRLKHAFNVLFHDGDPPVFDQKSFDPSRTPIDVLPLAAMPYNGLKRSLGYQSRVRSEAIHTIADLESWTVAELEGIDRFGPSSLEATDQALKELGRPGIFAFHQPPK